MNRLLNYTEDDWSNLEQQAKEGGGVTLENASLPVGCVPETSNVHMMHIRPDVERGYSALLISPKVQHNETIEGLRETSDSNIITKPDFQSLRSWIESVFLPRYVSSSNDVESQGEQPPALASACEMKSGPSVYCPNCNMADISVVTRRLKSSKEEIVLLDRAELRTRLERRVKGQNTALDVLTRAVVNHCARIQPARPAVLFAVGPTGVGKTHTAEVLAEELSDLIPTKSRYGFLRLDMTEYQDRSRVAQLLGAPQSYIGYKDGSQFLDTLRANPRTIVLFDEMEKAHRNIWRVLMNAMDAGRISTANRGSSANWEIDCKPAIFIFTSNLEAQGILDELQQRNGFGDQEVEAEICRRHLRASDIPPEIVGRIGRFMVFRPLGQQVRIEVLGTLVVKVAEEFGLDVRHIEPTIIVELLESSGGEDFGARPGRSCIEELLGDAFIDAIQRELSGPLTVSGPPYVCVPRHCTGENHE